MDIHKEGMGLVSWHAPSPGWLKLNVDGSVNPTNALCGCGGVLRDTDGNWIMGFSMRSSFNDILCVELEAIKQGLDLAWVHRVRSVWCETDSLQAFSILQDVLPCRNLHLR